MPPRPSPFRTWLQLLRAPNLFTVPGDPVAGYLLASYGAVEGSLALAVGASLCFYAGGLLLNDLADLREDRAERPERPLPSGAASLRAVGLAMVGLFAAALALCAVIGGTALATGIVLTLAILAYNLRSKHLPVVGALNMGACRGLSVLLGATAVPHGDLTIPLILRGRLDHVAIVIVLVVGYIAAVTHLARFETRTKVPSLAKWLPALPLLVGIPLFLACVSPIAHAQQVVLWAREAADPITVMISARRISAILFLVAGVRVLQTIAHLFANPAAPVPPSIGELIRTLLVIQAAICAAAGGICGSLASIAVLTLWPLSRMASRWFYAS